jgi:nucleoid-associated protein EbfC
VNIGQIAKMAQQMQAQMAQAQEELRETTLEATAGGGAVRVVITGAQEVRTIEIDRDAVDPDEVEMLQDLVLTAVNEASRKVEATVQEKVGALTGGLKLPGM